MPLTIEEAPARATRSTPAWGAAVTWFLHSAWFAYAALVLLQLRVIWNLWNVRDLSTGDTSSYFLYALHWFKGFQVDIAWSPLYTAFFGSFLFVNPDAAQAVLLHRLVIIFTASILTLAVLRRLLPATLAWPVAAWWVVLPINFNTIFEVHLFAVLPLLVTWLLLAGRNRWTRGAALAVLATSVVLVRAEMSVATGLLGLALLVYEWRTRRHAPRALHRPGPALLMAYGLPLAVAAVLCLFTYQRSVCKFPELSKNLSAKHTINMGQVFAAGYQQRHPEWTHCMWTEYQKLMRKYFGADEPALGQMLASNPRAVLDHFAWNWQLAPSGLQVLLFNAMAGDFNPDYPPVQRHPRWARSLSLLVLACWAGGFIVLVCNWRFWWRAWLKRRGLVWVGMLAVAAVAPLVISTQRPRPSYLFGLSVFLMAGTGMSVFVLSRRLGWKRPVPVWVQAVVAAVIALASPYYFASASAPQRPVLAAYRHMKPFAKVLQSPDTAIVQGDGGYEMVNYLGQGRCKSLGYGMILHEWPAGMPLEQFLATRGANALYLADWMVVWLECNRSRDAQAFLGAAPPGWQRLGGGDTPGDRWRLFQKVAPQGQPEQYGAGKG